VGRLAMLLACAVAGTLLIGTGVASALSRGFRILNRSSHPLRLESATPVTKETCEGGLNVGGFRLCTDLPIFGFAFEGRPNDGAVIQPSVFSLHDWELKYFPDPFGRCDYAANLKYKIEGTDGTLDVGIQTCTFSSNSSCKIEPATLGRCDADPFMGRRRIIFFGTPALRSGSRGNDTLSGGPGNDNLSGGLGRDTISGGLGNDTLSGGPGNDTVSGGPGNDLISGGTGNDTVSGGTGNDVIYGGPGNDRIVDHQGATTVLPGSGTNRIDVADGHRDDRVVCLPGSINHIRADRGDRISRSCRGKGSTIRYVPS
jgi:RTX calcium-binding nonapeptide repeat (4 copies)